MPSSLNRLFRRLREHNAERQKRKKSQQPTAEDHQQNGNNINNVTAALSFTTSSGGGGGIGGCCSRKTSSTMSRDLHPISRLHFPSRKGSSSSAKFCSPASSPEPALPDPLLHRIFDSIESPFELVRLRRVNKASADYVNSKICRITEMDLRRVGFETLSSSSTGTTSSNGSQQPDTSVIVAGDIWHVHPSGCKVLCRLCPAAAVTAPGLAMKNAGDESYNESFAESQLDQKLRLEVLVDDQWTSREIVVLCSLVNEFRRFVRRLSLDAPIFELIVANLAAVDLDRWFAFQCFVKAVDECQMDAALNKLAAQLQQEESADLPLGECEPEEHMYWPNAKTILIRTTERESVHLARLLNYGVRSNLVMDRRRLDRLSLQVCVTDANKTATRPKELVRNLYHFRCWAGSPGFDERFSQLWRVGGKVVV